MTIRGVLTLLLTSTMTLATNAQNEVMTPEKLWELQRVNLAGVSPDGSTVLYNITRYDVAANQGTTRIAACNLSGQQRQLTDGTQSAQAIGFTPSGRIAYLQQGQLWTMTPNGEDARQATHIEGGIENVLFSPQRRRGTLYPPGEIPPHPRPNSIPNSPKPTRASSTT